MTDLLQKEISGWANTNFSYSSVAFPETNSEIISIIEMAKRDNKKVIARGAGRSYGDESLNKGEIVLDMSKMNKIISWNKSSGLLCVEAGVTCDDVLTRCLRDGWMLAVVPGTRFVTIGGALANNVHGKNSYLLGNFGRWVREFKIICASGECCPCSEKTNNDLFTAVIGGAGLLGVVVEITLQLVRVSSPHLSVRKTTKPSLNELIDSLDNMSEKNDFAIAQVDCFPKKAGLGRGTIHVGSYIISNDFGTMDLDKMRQISPRMFGLVPKKAIPIVGRYILNDYVMQLVSGLKYLLDKMTSSNKAYYQDIFQFTFLLDGIPNWIKTFRHGLFEYEPLIPKNTAKEIIPQLIALTHKYKMPAYLSAIKIHSQDNFLLSYSMDGYSFALDIPRHPERKEKQDALFREMNKMVIRAGGIVYLAKDANLTGSEFRQMYKNFEKFTQLKRKYDPSSLFQSDMYRRLFQENLQQDRFTNYA